jgi:hypothetical protein
MLQVYDDYALYRATLVISELMCVMIDSWSTFGYK